MALLQLSRLDRLLVFAPHPDDETLASGMLIQSALAAGAAVRIVFATDGDNNPWPQRWLERHWTIGMAERARWGQRRRREAAAALALLGVDGPQAVRFLGWPDQQLTDCLMRDDEAVRTLGEEIERFEPSHIAMPSLADRHPDHSALRVLLDLALLHTGTDCVRLGYIVHGEGAGEDGDFCSANPLFQQTKCAAMEAHASQVALSRRRLLALAVRPEQFDVSTTVALTSENASLVRIPHAGRWSLRRRELLLLIATRRDTFRFRVALGPFSLGVSSRHAAATHEIGIQVDAAAVNVMLPSLAVPVAAIYAKLDRVGTRLMIFDNDRWRTAGDLLSETTCPLKNRTAPSLG